MLHDEKRFCDPLRFNDDPLLFASSETALPGGESILPRLLLRDLPLLFGRLFGLLLLRRGRAWDFWIDLLWATCPCFFIAVISCSGSALPAMDRPGCCQELSLLLVPTIASYEVHRRLFALLLSYQRVRSSLDSPVYDDCWAFFSFGSGCFMFHLHHQKQSAVAYVTTNCHSKEDIRLKMNGLDLSAKQVQSAKWE